MRGADAGADGGPDCDRTLFALLSRLCPSLRTGGRRTHQISRVSIAALRSFMSTSKAIAWRRNAAPNRKADSSNLLLQQGYIGGHLTAVAAFG